MSKILSFDTSNYTTSSCLFDTDKGVLWDNKIMLPVVSGKCGLRQSEAVFLHNRNLKDLMRDFPVSDIDFVAASSCPSEKTDSYMPCFTVGVSFASAISSILGVPLYTCSHQKNHIGSALFTINGFEADEFFAYHVSGGTTDILLCNIRDNNLQIKKVGGTADINCGQLIDRIGTALNFPFPCGKYIERISSGELKNNVKISKSKFYYNFSGFENKAVKMISDGFSNEDVSDYLLSIIYSFLTDSINDLRTMYKPLPVILSGGVMSNKIISGLIKENLSDVYFAKPEYSSDSALGTAYMCALERGLLNG